MSGGVESLEAMFGDSGGWNGGREPRKKRRGRGWAIAAWIVGVLAILVTAAYFVSDAAIRSTIEGVAESQIQSKLPDTITGKITVKVDGPSVLYQYLTGSFSDVVISSPKLVVDDVPTAVHFVARGVSTDVSKPVKDLSGTVTLGATTIGTLAQFPGATGEPTLGNGTMTFTGTQSALGANLGYTVTTKPSLDGANMVVTPTAAVVKGAPAGADTSPITGALMATKPTVCLAKYLPAGAKPTGVSVTPEGLALAFDVKNVSLSALGDRGTCP